MRVVVSVLHYLGAGNTVNRMYMYANYMYSTCMMYANYMCMYANIMYAPYYPENFYELLTAVLLYLTANHSDIF